MPLYNYRCTAGHVTEELCKSDLSDAPKTCRALVPGTTHNGQRVCGRRVERVMAVPASTFPGADHWRTGGL